MCWPMPPNGKPQVILIGTGSEVMLWSEAYEKLKAEGIQARVVSMPSWDFSSARIKRTEIGPSSFGYCARLRGKIVRVRLGTLCRIKGRIIGMRTFGASAPAKDLQKKFGFTTDA